MKTYRKYLAAMGAVFHLLGLALGGLYLWLDPDGFFGGMFAGASVTSIIFGAYVYVRYLWWDRERDAEAADWLPSRSRADRDRDRD